jgi:hypothetical protein
MNACDEPNSSTERRLSRRNQSTNILYFLIVQFTVFCLKGGAIEFILVLFASWIIPSWFHSPASWFRLVFVVFEN